MTPKEPSTDHDHLGLFRALVTTVNVVALASVAGDVGTLLELRRQGLPIVEIAVHDVSPWVWSVELWAASVWASRRLLRAVRLDLAAFTALLPLLALLGTRALGAP